MASRSLALDRSGPKLHHHRTRQSLKSNRSRKRRRTDRARDPPKRAPRPPSQTRRMHQGGGAHGTVARRSRPSRPSCTYPRSAGGRPRRRHSTDHESRTKRQGKEMATKSSWWELRHRRRLRQRLRRSRPRSPCLLRIRPSSGVTRRCGKAATARGGAVSACADGGRAP